MIGKVFGRWTVTEQAKSRKKPSGSSPSYWKCVCSCGRQKEVNGDSLRNGRSKSCGCLHREICVNTQRTHGKSKTELYSIWEAMLQRTGNSSGLDPATVKNYKGRGIGVCKRWLAFINFYTDMGERPKGMTLERIDNNKGYSKDNCRWATRKEQANNRRTNVHIRDKDGEMITMAQATDKYGLRRTRFDYLKRTLGSAQIAFEKLYEEVSV